MAVIKHIKSDSSPQRAVEKIVREQLAERLKWPGILKSHNLPYGKSYMEFDCYGTHDGTVLLGEIYARHGKLDGSQPAKVLKDILKMYAQSVELKQNGAISVRMVMVFTNEEAANYLTGRSWAAEVAKNFGIEPLVVTLNSKQIGILQKAQKDQNFHKKLDADNFDS